jgi:hypothetical protein
MLDVSSANETTPVSSGNSEQIMKPRIILCLALIFSGGVFGCATRPLDGLYSSSASGTLHFKGYQEAYSYIAKCEGLSEDYATALKLAAESKTEITPVENVGVFHIIEASYYVGGYDQIRGAQANGRYYVLRERSGSFDLAGVLEGNIYRWNNVGENVALQTHWHSSGGNAEGDWINYPWDGRVFGAIAPARLPTFYRPTSP